MSDLGESGSSGLSDWALVNSQGELEGSDVDSNSSSIEVVGRETEVEEDGGHDDLASRESSPEFIELEQLMKTADTVGRLRNLTEKADAVEDRREGEGSHRQEECRERVTLLPPDSAEDELCIAASFGQQSALETVGACSLETLQRRGKRGSSEGKERARGRPVGKPALASQLSHESDTPTSCDSVLSVSAVSSVSSISRSSRTDSDSESDFVRLEKDSSCVSTESEGEESHPSSRANVMVTSGSSVGTGFNFLCNTQGLQQPPHPQQTPPQPVLASQEVPLLAHPQEEEEEIIPAHEDESMHALEDAIMAGQEQEAAVGEREDGNGAAQEEMMHVHERQRVHAPEEEVAPEQEEEVIAAQEDEVDLEEEMRDEQDEEPEELQAQPHQEAPPAAIGAEVEDEAVPQNEADEMGDDDADTESSTEEGDQDDRIESEQSDDSHSAPPDDLDQGDLSVVNDIGDLPVGRGDVERHYIHCNNQQLNGRLNRVVLAMLVLALGMGLGHWIGSTREHFSQLEIQLSQMKRLHQMQDEYMQCLARNDELLVDSDIALQNERERHQEAIADLRDNNRELQEQLQDAQDRLEQLLTASVRIPRVSQHHLSPASLARDLQYALTLSKLLVASEDQFQIGLSSWGSESQEHLLQARETFSQVMEEKQTKQRNQVVKRLQQEVADEKRLNLELQVIRQRLNERLNFLEAENADLRVAVGKMRYQAASEAGKSAPPTLETHPSSSSREPLPPPPRPVPPPPFAASGDVQKALEQREQQESGLNGKGTQPAQVDKQSALRTGEVEADRTFYIPANTEDQAEVTDMEQESEDATQMPGDSAQESGGEGETREESSEEEAEELIQDKGPDVPEDWNIREASSTKNHCGSGEMPRPIPVDITLLQRNLTQERQRAEMWRHLYLWEREEKRGMNASACLQYLMQSVNMSGLMQLMDRWNVTGAGVEGMTDLTSLVTSIAQLHQHLLQSLPALWQDLSTNLQDLHSDLSQQEPPQPQGDHQAGGEEEGDGKASAEDPPHSRWSDGVKTLLNKTRGTLSNVSRHLQQTWDQVKDVSRHLWPSNDSVIGRMAAHVKESVSKLSHKVQGKAVHWFRRRSRLGKHGQKKGHQEAFPEEENDQEEERKSRKRWDERSVQQALRKEDGGEYHRKSHFQSKDSDGWKNWSKPSQRSFDGHHQQDYKNENKSVNSQKHEHSPHRMDERSSKHHHKNSHSEERKHEQVHRHHSDDSDHKESRKEMSEKFYHNDSHRKYSKRYSQNKNHHRDPHGRKETEESSHRHKDWHDRNTRDEKHHPEESGGKKDQDEKKDRRSDNKENTDTHRPDNKEAKFSTKAKHHSSHVDKAADKVKHKIQKQFHNLFAKIGAMSRQSFQAMERDDLEDMMEDAEEVFGRYSDSKHLGLPPSGYQWLQCQLHFWSRAEAGRVRYDPEGECLQYLAPWQLGLVMELRERVERGECSKVRTISCVDDGGLEADKESYYKYVCSDDRNHEHDDDDDEDDEDDDDCHKPKKRKSRLSPKGQREGEHGETKQVSSGHWNTNNAKESTNKQVNHSDEDARAWYFHWVEGRDNLRSVERKADWLFERASERHKTREQEHKADWMFDRAFERGKMRKEDHKADWVFERAADRNTHHDDEEEAGVQNQKDKHHKWHGERTRAKHDHHKKEGHFRQDRKHHWHKDTKHHFKHDEKDHQQKYGRTFF